MYMMKHYTTAEYYVPDTAKCKTLS